MKLIEALTTVSLTPSMIGGLVVIGVVVVLGILLIRGALR
jgi:hypothetical protein